LPALVRPLIRSRVTMTASVAVQSPPVFWSHWMQAVFPVLSAGTPPTSCTHGPPRSSPQMPALHVACAALHTTPQAPQLFGSVWKLTQTFPPVANGQLSGSAPKQVPVAGSSHWIVAVIVVNGSRAQTSEVTPFAMFVS